MRPSLTLLDPALIARIVAEARTVLSETGVQIHNHEILAILADHGATVDSEMQRAFLPDPLLDRAISDAPDSVTLYDVTGGESIEFTGRNVHFTPGSSALSIVDEQARTARSPTTADYMRYARLVSRLEHIAMQSTAFIPGDVHEHISDSYRLYLSLLFCDKPVITGGFGIESFALMKDLLVAVRGSEAALAARPPAAFSCCITSPLKWSDVTSHHLLECARAGIPAEIISMPMAGVSSPVTLVGTLIQHTAEVLSGVVISQVASPGAPVFYGGSPAVFDMRQAAAPMGAVESMMLACAYNEIGKHLGMPTQAYAGLTDAKVTDAQAGLEASMGATMAALSGINSVAGPGMMDYQKCFSLEKLVLDNEMCGLALRLVRGVTERDDFPIAPRLAELDREGHLLMSEHTLRHLRGEQYIPGVVLERAEREKWEERGGDSLIRRARNECDRLTSEKTRSGITEDVIKELRQRMEHEAKRCGMNELPGIEI